MKSRTGLISGVVLLLATTVGHAATSTVGTNFSASDPLFPGGISAGFDVGAEINLSPVPVRLGYEAAANTGTVNAGVNGSIRATYDNVINSSNTSVVLDFLGGASSLSSSFGAAAALYARFVLTVPVPIFPDININERIDILSAGLILQPTPTGFTANIGALKTASDTETAAGVGPNINFGVGSLGASGNLDINQNISLRPTALQGLLRGVNQNNGNVVVNPFSIGSSDSTGVNLSGLDAGLWEFSLLDMDLLNTFRNDVNLQVSASLNYIIGSFNTGPLASIGLLDQSFSLDFNQLDRTNVFRIFVTPIPAAVWLFGTALIGFVGFARRRVVA